MAMAENLKTPETLEEWYYLDPQLLAELIILFNQLNK
jgi:hypothetical protein